MFPVRTGMNRDSATGKGKNMDVPRTHGDEPYSGSTICVEYECSPYARG
mgnify:CR=1 FL=1